MSISSLMFEKVALPGLALVLGVVAGRSSLYPSVFDSGDLANSARSAATDGGGSPHSLSGRPGHRRADREREAGLLTLGSALEKSTPSERMRSLFFMLEGLAPEEFPGMLDAMRNAGQDLAFPYETRLIFSAWADLDPMAAAEHLRLTSGDSEMKNAVMAAWAATDPMAAEQWAREHHDSVEANPWLVGVIQGIAGSDVEMALTLIEGLPRGRERNQALESTLGHVFLQGREAAAAWINNVEDGQIQEKGAEWLAGHMADRDPLAAAGWVSSLGAPEARSEAAEEVASRYARSDLESAQAWTLTLPEDTRWEAAKGVVDQLARQDPVAAFDWLASLGGGGETEGMLRDIVRRGFDEDPAAALTTALHLQDDRDRERFTARYLDRWVESDPAAASQWLHTHFAYLPESIRTRHAPEQ